MFKEKLVRHPWVFFDAATIRAGIESIVTQSLERLKSTMSHYYPEGATISPDLKVIEVAWDHQEWHFTDLDEFLSELATAKTDNRFRAANLEVQVDMNTMGLALRQRPWGCEVVVRAEDREMILRTHQVFAEAADRLREEPTRIDSVKPRVFIGHGGKSTAWMNLERYLRASHDLEVIAYETGARSGHHIRDVLETMLSESTFAILVMTEEDAMEDGGIMRARQNVVHEAGLFQGRLGFSRTVVLRERNVELFSNLDGVQYISFTEIREAYGDVIATLRREFGPL